MGKSILGAEKISKRKDGRWYCIVRLPDGLE